MWVLGMAARLPQEAFATEHAERLLFDAAMGGMWSGVGVASTPWSYHESIGRQASSDAEDSLGARHRVSDHNPGIPLGHRILFGGYRFRLSLYSPFHSLEILSAGQWPWPSVPYEKALSVIETAGMVDIRPLNKVCMSVFIHRNNHAPSVRHRTFVRLR